MLIKNQRFLDPPPASPGSQNGHVLKGFQLKITAFWIPGPPWPAPALKINTFEKDFT